LDQVGGVRHLTDPYQNTIKSYAYEPFGRILRETGRAPNPFGFPGTYLILLDLNDVRLSPTRHYGASTGRFAQRDPIGMPNAVPGPMDDRPALSGMSAGAQAKKATALNQYAYDCEGPLSGVDPSGMGPLFHYVKQLELYFANEDVLSKERAAYIAWQMYKELAYIVDLASTFFMGNKPIALSFLKRWLSKKGGKVDLAGGQVSDLLRDPEVSKRLAEQLAGVPEGQLDGLKLKELTAKSGTDYFYALGWFEVVFTGCHTRHTDGSKHSLEGEFGLRDTYDWQQPRNKFVDIKGDRIYDKYATLVEDAGYAKAFQVGGTYSGKITVGPAAPNAEDDRR
jgi:hypothetical protein